MIGLGTIINAGAIVLADLLITELEDPATEFLNFVRALCGSDSVDYHMIITNRHMQLATFCPDNLRSHKFVGKSIIQKDFMVFRMTSVNLFLLLRIQIRFV